MGYTALYRKFRPLNFSEMVGQEHITRTLKNQIMANRVGHAYLFNGGRGTGKTSAAKILARAINCLNPKDGEPCNECEICKGAISGSLTDIVEMDAASNNSVEDIRSIREEVNFLPTKAKYRVYIIDEVHMLSTGAFNALLKTLEEPPEHVKFILATTEPQKLPATILSRCQRFDFKKISNQDIIKRLEIVCKESNIEITKEALNIIATLSEGAMRDALSILERCIQDGENQIDEDKIKNGDNVADVLSKIGEENGAEVSVSSTADMSAMMGGGGISIRLEGDDLNDLRSAAIKVQNALGDIEGVSEVSDVNENSSSEIKVIIDREKAMKHGLTVAQVYTQISSKLSGESEATGIEYEGSERSVIVSSDAADDKMSQNQLMNMEISAGTSSTTGASAGSGESVKLKDIANVQKDKTLDTITRTDQKRAQTVTASVDEGYNITLTTDKAEAAVEKLELPESVNVVIEGENEQIMDAMGQLVKMFLLGIFLIYLVMVAQFQSLLSPFIVMFTIPLAITGAMAGLLITGNVLSVVAMVGIIMLMGIIVNNAIVLIDCINRLRAEGMDRRKSIIEAGAIRMRPVLMTAATTILGLLPMAVGTGSGSEMIQPVAVVCIGGLLYATLMTLFVIPVMYDILASKKTKVISEDELTITLE